MSIYRNVSKNSLKSVSLDTKSNDYYFITNITESKRETGHYFVLIIGTKNIRLIEHASPNTNVFELDWHTHGLKINNETKGTEFNQAFYIKIKRMLELPLKSQAVIFRKSTTTITPFKIKVKNEVPTQQNPLFTLLLSEGFFRTQEDMSASEIIDTTPEIEALISHFKLAIAPLRQADFSPPSE
jgi:hypothetical protein